MQRTKRVLAVVAAWTVVVAGLGLSTTGLAEATRPVPEPPHPKTIVRVTGDAAHGFGIHRYDGTTLFPPTDSEARAECRAYDRRAARVRCRTEVRVQYAGFAELQRSLAYVRSKRR